VYPNPTFEQLTKTRAELFIKATLLEMTFNDAGTPEKDLPELGKILGIQILDKRIDVMKLPIKFTAPAKMAVLAYVDSPGKIIALLIDCLTAYEGQTVDVAKLVSLYPDGFYTQECFEKYVEELIKPKKIKWAEIY
jgi:hypothetical protein